MDGSGVHEGSADTGPSRVGAAGRKLLRSAPRLSSWLNPRRERPVSRISLPTNRGVRHEPQRLPVDCNCGLQELSLLWRDERPPLGSPGDTTSEELPSMAAPPDRRLQQVQEPDHREAEIALKVCRLTGLHNLQNSKQRLR